MRMHCTKCQQTFENCIQCPDCGARLVYPAERRSSEHDMSAFAGSDAFRWKKPAREPEEAPREKSGNAVGIAVVAILAALAAGTVAYLARIVF